MSQYRKDRLEEAISSIDIRLLNSHQTERETEEGKAINTIKTNPKHFFTYAKKHLKTKSAIGPFKIEEKLITQPKEISQQLSEQYS